jgi:hypothetical protein
MLNITLADVEATEAAMRPLAGFGAGAFTCDGAGVGSLASQQAVGLALPRIKGASAVVPPVQAWTADAIGTGFQGRTVGNGGSTSGASSKQHNQMTRIYPVAPGGLGPHPAREPDPV